MLLPSIASPVSSALSQITAHHGHKKGVHGDSSSDGTQATSGDTQSLFGDLLQSIEQTVGVTSSPTTGSTSTANSTAVAPLAATVSNPQTQSASTQLQNYLNNAAQNLLSGNVRFNSNA